MISCTKVKSLEGFQHLLIYSLSHFTSETKVVQRIKMSQITQWVVTELGLSGVPMLIFSLGRLPLQHISFNYPSSN